MSGSSQPNKKKRVAIILAIGGTAIGATVAVTLAAGSVPPTISECTAASEQFEYLLLSEIEAEFGAEMRDRLRSSAESTSEILYERCQDEAWSKETLACVMAASESKAAAACNGT